MMKSILTVAACSVFLTASASAVNIATNGSFETPDTGGLTDSLGWSEFGSVSERVTGTSNSGLASHSLVASGSSAAGASAGINQNSIADGGFASLEELTTVDVSFWHNTELGVAGVSNAFVRILDGVGNIVADSGAIPLSDTGGAFVQVNAPTLNVPAFGASPADTYAAFVEFTAAAGAVDGSVSSSFIDDVVIDATLVPEPASLGLLSVAGLGLIRRRRA